MYSTYILILLLLKKKTVHNAVAKQQLLRVGDVVCASFVRICLLQDRHTHSSSFSRLFLLLKQRNLSQPSSQIRHCFVFSCCYFLLHFIFVLGVSEWLRRFVKLLNNMKIEPHFEDERIAVGVIRPFLDIVVQSTKECRLVATVKRKSN